MKLKPILLEVNLDFGVLYQTNSVLIKPFIQYYICKHFACNMYLTILIHLLHISMNNKTTAIHHCFVTPAMIITPF